MDNLQNKKVAIVCDWLTGYGGAERVVLELHKMLPGAPIYTSQYDPTKIDWFKDADVRTTWLQKLPNSLRKFLPVLRALAFSRLDLREYDLVITSSGAEAKFIKKLKSSAKHICYCHSPTHYYWIRYDDYMQNPSFGKLNWLARFGLKMLAGPMRRWDYKAAQRPNVFIANSNYTKQNIKKFYNRDSTVVHPPVDIERFKLNAQIERHGFLTAGRQTYYKRIDLAVAACTKLNLPLKVIGNGPEHDRLVKMAGPTIEFLTDVNDVDMPRYFQQAMAFIFPGKEDFGIVAVEAMAAGAPVIAYKAGGALDFVVPGQTGEFFEQQTEESLVNVLKTLDKTNYQYDQLVFNANKYNASEFSKRINNLITESSS